MARIILAAAALLVAGEVRGETYSFFIYTESEMETFLAAEFSPGDDVRIRAAGFLLDVEGSFATDTARFVGWVGSRGGQGPHPDDGFNFWMDVPLRSDVYWRVAAEDRIGVLRGSDAEGITGIPNNLPGLVDLPELNAVRNKFGAVRSLPLNDWGTQYMADVNYDDRVDIEDLNVVRNNFGLSGSWEWIAPDGPFCQVNNWQECRPLRPTPEPSAIALLITALFGLSTRRGRAPR